MTLVALCSVLAALAFSASAAVASDSIYWSTNADTVRVAALDGSGSPSNLFTAGSGARGVAVDPAAGKIYSDTGGGGTGNIVVANLDGTGVSTLYIGEDGPESIAVDPAAGKIYWADFGADTIRVANLDGAGSPTTLFSGESAPVGVAIDPAAGKVYWTDSLSGLIRVGNIDGSGSPTTLFSGESSPRGVAIDPTGGKIYWATEIGGGAVRVGNLDGTGSASDLFTGQDEPWGVAIDPSAGKIYWADNGAGTVDVANLNGSGSPIALFSGENGPKNPVLLRAPANTEAPQISGGSSTGSTLTCTQGLWDTFTGGSLYRAPSTFAYQWLLGGTPIPGATAATHAANAPGNYTCRVTATDEAGSTAQTSAPHAVSATVSQLSVSPHTFSIAGRRVHGKCAKASSQNHAKPRCKRAINFKITFTLNGASTVTLTFERKLAGRKVNGRCVKPTKKNKHKPHCTQVKLVPGTITIAGKAGANSFKFNGKVGGHRLARGSYTVLATPSQGTAASASFRIVR